MCVSVCLCVCVCACELVLPMSKGGYKVETAVDSAVLDVLPVQSALVSEVLLKLLIDVVCDGPPAGNIQPIKS